MESSSYNQKKNINKNTIFKNANIFQNFLNSLNNSNIDQNIYKDNIYNEELFNKTENKINNNNKIIIPKNLKNNHISPVHINRTIFNKKNETIRNNIIILKNAKYKAKSKLLNTGNNNKLNNYKIIKNNNTFISKVKSQIQPQKGIKIINILLPKNKISNFYKVKKNSFTSNLFIKNLDNINYTVNYKNKRKDILNTYYDKKNSQNDLISFYYNNSSLIDKYKDNKILFPKNSKTSFNIEKTHNQSTNTILKTNSCFINLFNRNNIITINLKKNDAISFNYTVPNQLKGLKQIIINM